MSPRFEGKVQLVCCRIFIRVTAVTQNRTTKHQDIEKLLALTFFIIRRETALEC